MRKQVMNIENASTFTELTTQEAANVNGGNLLVNDPYWGPAIMTDPILGPLVAGMGPLPGVNYNPSTAPVNFPTAAIQHALQQGLIGGSQPPAYFPVWQ